MKPICFALCVVSLGLFYLASAEIGENVKIQPYKKYSSSCKELNPKKSGVQKIQVGSYVIEVYCDVTIAGKGWLVVQRRVSVEENFYRNWTSYQTGFGDLKGNFFIGLNNLNKISSLQPQELYIELVDFAGEKRYAHYSVFHVGNVYSNYPITQLGAYSGTAGDSLSYHLYQPFSTFDRDNDNATINCAARYMGAWWYRECLSSNLNGAYLGGSHTDPALFGSGIVWGEWKGFTYSYKTINIMVRPK
ncbi:ficolin-1 [Drosophila sechellia]|uniref:GM21726 n=1 Tax=Drosophila sechellia TaxID=7238 RepID=B4HT95_DROSE|nr:ficolin-1 [Drosophila sechellia]EDW48196.1 GM21726 [Drosophila sechellia]